MASVLKVPVEIETVKPVSEPTCFECLVGVCCFVGTIMCVLGGGLALLGALK